MPAKVLLVEDDKNLGLIIQEHLQMNGFEVRLCVDGVDGWNAFQAEPFDICLLDVMMPRKDGFSLAAEIRAVDENVPLIFLTAKSLKEDKIAGFKIGCDDYVTKPFSIEELLMRIAAVLRRSRTGPSEKTTVFKIGSYSFDSAKQTLVNDKNEHQLTTRESELLRLLCLRQNDTLTRAEALKDIWGDENYYAGRSMDVFVSKLRKYLADDDSIQILNVHGKGFRLNVD